MIELQFLKPKQPKLQKLIATITADKKILLNTSSTKLIHDLYFCRIAINEDKIYLVFATEKLEDSFKVNKSGGNCASISCTYLDIKPKDKYNVELSKYKEDLMLKLTKLT